MTQTRTASAKHKTTAICLFETLPRMLEGIYLLGDQRDVLFGDIQNVDDDETEDEEDDDEEVPECREYFEMGSWDAVVSSFGDFSQNGSRGGELMSRHTVLSRNPMSAPCEVFDQRLI